MGRSRPQEEQGALGPLGNPVGDGALEHPVRGSLGFGKEGRKGRCCGGRERRGESRNDGVQDEEARGEFIPRPFLRTYCVAGTAGALGMRTRRTQ
jgi:hypothetical protein